MLSKESRLVDFTDIHSDNRGSISSIVNEACNNVSIIETNAGSIRSNHYHKKDWHYMLVLEGKLDYFYFSNFLKKVMFINVLPGQIIFTPNLEVHATFFPDKSKLVVISGFLRDSKTYENDTVRLDFINYDNIEEAKKENFIWQPKISLF
jgi:oxalate decarboxylase/phosphoglucose isomerase-like protein (cupin superfamily)